MSTIDPRDLFISANPTGLSSAELAKDTSGFVDDRTHADYLVFKAGFDAAQPAEQPQGGLAIPDECPHLIVFDDTEVGSLMFSGAGARAAALKKWEAVSTSWNAHLFVRVARNSRDDAHLCAIVADPGEVERLKHDLRLARAQGRAEVVEMIAQLDAETGLDEFIGSHAIADTGDYGSHWKEDELRQHFNVDPAAASELEMCRYSAHQIIQVEEEVKQLQGELGEAKGEYDRSANKVAALRAQLAERDALLRDIEKRHWSGVDFDLPADLVAELKALSAGAEPSAPVEREPLVSEDELRDLAASACQSALAHGISEDWFMRLASTVEQRARAALERKP